MSQEAELTLAGNLRIAAEETACPLSSLSVISGDTVGGCAWNRIKRYSTFAMKLKMTLVLNPLLKCGATAVVFRTACSFLRLR